ncbi:putative glycosyl transferase, family 28 (plasmid) [Nostoc sp. HK-01]|nr:putative glycosyl transferase, family 28 [Nostoc sp. HK-01]
MQPYCALAIGLKRAGHEVTVAANENFESFVRQFDLEFAPIAGNSQELLQSKKGMRLIAGEKVPMVSDKLLLQQMHSAMSATSRLRVYAACQGTEVIIYTPLTNWGYHIAEKLGVPCFMASVVPLTPTGTFPFLRFSQIANNPLSKR